MKDNERKKIVIAFSIVAILLILFGSTFAYWRWQTADNQRTNIILSVESGFNCTADGGGNITANDKKIAPASCVNSAYAIKRIVNVGSTITLSNVNVYLDLWLKVNLISPNLAASQNLRYALTTSSANCTTGIVAQGNFYGAETGTKKTLLHNKLYSATAMDTYYLWIWLDSAEDRNDTQSQSFNVELGGSCTDEEPNTN